MRPQDGTDNDDKTEMKDKGFRMIVVMRTTMMKSMNEVRTCNFPVAYFFFSFSLLCPRAPLK